MAQPDKPALWQAAKKHARSSSDGGAKGRWSPRKAALARLDYAKRGGRWKQTEQSRR